MLNQSSRVSDRVSYTKELHQMAKEEGGFGNIDKNYYGQFINSKILDTVRTMLGESNIKNNKSGNNTVILAAMVKDLVPIHSLNQARQELSSDFLTKLVEHAVKIVKEAS